MNARGEAVGEVRCPVCGALVGADVEWCPQCFASLRQAQPPPIPTETPEQTPEPPRPAPTASLEGSAPPAPPPGSLDAPPAAAEAVRASAGAGSVDTAEDRPAPVWTCPVCETANPLVADSCTVCGTPFAQLMREDRTTGSVDPGAAMRRSLLLPGLGHRMVGETLDGIVWGFLFVFVLLMALLLLLARAGESLGPIVPILGALLAVAVLIWAFTAMEAARLARGNSPMLPRKRLPWVAAGVVGVVLVLSLMIVMSATKGR